MGTDVGDVARALPDYEIGREVGRGAYGIVWSGRHRQLGREVAIKQLVGTVAANDEHHARFRREARILAQMDHPHVVTVYDYREHDELRLLVMELLTGRTFADRRAAGMAAETAIASILAAASGLHHVHRQGILHRDVKPENLMFDRWGALKVTDFGIARADVVDATAIDLTHAGQFFGTPAYVSPEQAGHALAEGWPPIDAASDQYSLAAVLYEALSGQLTHDATGGAVALCTRRMNTDARPLREVAPAISAEIEAVVMKALAREPSRRFATTEEFALALGTAAANTFGPDWLARSETLLRDADGTRDTAAARGRPSTPPRPTGKVPPSGTVTLLFTDIAGSTKLWEAHPEAMRVALMRHDELVRDAVESAGGYVFKTVGDAFCAAFAAATDAVRAADAGQRALVAEEWPDPIVIRVRMAIHTGECAERDGDYFGTTVNRVARLEALAHGGQIVMSGATAGVLGGALPNGLTLRDMGNHRLKDLATPEHVFQVDLDGLARDFPALRSLDNPDLPNNLPRVSSSLIGRAEEQAEVRRLVDSSRLVTLTGAGGAGKTRLALQVAADLLDGSGDGVWLVELAAVADSDRVAATVAAVLGVREGSAKSLTDVLVDALAECSLLIVIDNCEHVIDAVAKLADRLLRACPGVELIATSREPLGIDGEAVYRVPSLGVPAADAALDAVAVSDAVRLFVDRARAQQPGFDVDAENSAVVVTIVRRLDGIPLALELAAARLRSLTLEEISERLDHRFRLLTTGGRVAEPRQQTLRGAIEWSYDLLNPPEQEALRRASVFAGGFDLAAAEAVLGDGEVDAFAVIDVVDRLVDKSLVQRDPATKVTSRYRLLESIRAYAAEQFAADPPSSVAGVRRAFLAHYVGIAERARPQLAGPDAVTWNEQLAADHDNFFAALDVAVALPDCTALGLRLAAALSRYWTGNGWCGQLVEPLRVLCDREADDADRAAGWAMLALASCWIGEARAGYEVAIRAVELARRVGDPWLVARALRCRSTAANFLGDQANALADAEEACVLAAQTDDIDLQAQAVHVRAIAHYGMGDGDAARIDFGIAIELHRAAGDLYGEAVHLVNLADIELERDDLETAAAHLTAAVPLVERLGTPDLSSTLQENLGILASRRDDTEGARRHFVTGLKLAGRSRDNEQIAFNLIGYARCIVGTDAPLAATIAAAAEALLARIDLSSGPNEARLSSETRERLETALTAAELEAASERGRRLSVPELVALASAAQAPTLNDHVYELDPCFRDDVRGQ